MCFLLGSNNRVRLKNVRSIPSALFQTAQRDVIDATAATLAPLPIHQIDQSLAVDLAVGPFLFDLGNDGVLEADANVNGLDGSYGPPER